MRRGRGFPRILAFFARVCGRKRRFYEKTRGFLRKTRIVYGFCREYGRCAVGVVPGTFDFDLLTMSGVALTEGIICTFFKEEVMKKMTLLVGMLVMVFGITVIGCASSATAACPASSCEQSGFGMCGQAQCGTNWFAPCNCI